MKIASVTLAGPGTEDVIGDALRSVVDEVDVCLVIDTGEPTYGRGANLVTDAAAGVVGEKGIFDGHDWEDDFAKMRNLALDRASTRWHPWNTPIADALPACDWAVWLDTDERLMGMEHARAMLENVPAHVSVVNAWHVSGEYAKERFIRLPRQGRYIGPTHEFWEPEVGQATAQTREVAFDELPRDKDSPAWAAKLARDIRILTDYTSANPDDPNASRWYYYLGDAYAFSDIERAINYWKMAVASEGWSEIKGWAAMRAANALIEQERPDEALWMAVRGLVEYPHGPELFWAGAAASVAMKRYEDAIAWAMHSAICGSFAGWGKTVNRSAYVWPPAHWDAPYDILAHCYAKIGKKQLAKEADRKWREAKAAREAA